MIIITKNANIMPRQKVPFAATTLLKYVYAFKILRAQTRFMLHERCRGGEDA